MIDAYGTFYILVVVGGFMGALVVGELVLMGLDRLYTHLRERRREGEYSK